MKFQYTVLVSKTAAPDLIKSDDCGPGHEIAVAANTVGRVKLSGFLCDERKFVSYSVVVSFPGRIVSTTSGGQFVIRFTHCINMAFSEK
jgi:hypothetical protein